MQWGRAIIVACVVVMTGCYWSTAAGPSVEEQAAEDLGCDHVEARRVGSSIGGSRSSCRDADYIVEGCGSINHYRCIDTAGWGCNYICRRLGSNELRSN